MVSMKDEDLEKTMDNWASHEVEAAPQLRPKEEMYRMIEARKGKHVFSVYTLRVLVGAAAVCLVLSVVLLPAIFYLSDRDGEPSIGLREVTVPKQGVIVKNPPGRGRGGPKKGAAFPLRQLMFQYQQADSPSIYGIDLRFPMDEETTLATNDSYRFAVQTIDHHYVYIYQSNSSGKMLKLFPNHVYSPAQNPFKQEQIYHIPSAPNWFCLGTGDGEESIYVIASTKPIPELESLYNQYASAKGDLEKQGSLSLLLKRIEITGQGQDEEAVKWSFVFRHQSR